MMLRTGPAIYRVGAELAAGWLISAIFTTANEDDYRYWLTNTTGAALPPQVIPPADANVYGRHTP